MIVEHISFDNYDQEDWELFPVSVALPSPAPKLYTVDVPGSSRQLDFSEALNGQLQYENRTVGESLYLYGSQSAVMVTVSMAGSVAQSTDSRPQ